MTPAPTPTTATGALTWATRVDPGTRAAGGRGADRFAVDVDLGAFAVVFAVADGVGGLADPALAAETVVAHLPAAVAGAVGDRDGVDGAAAVTTACADLSRHLRATARCGPGSTGAVVALLLVRDTTALAVHVGDCRIYRLRAAGLTRLTTDHTRAGQLTRWMGMGEVTVPDVAAHRLRPGDRLLLCTDGLIGERTGGLTDAALAGLLGGAPDPDRACAALVAAARAGGATDDIAVIAVDVR